MPRRLSHHLAHAWSVIAQAPFDRGLVVVMDGMGELHSAMSLAAAEGEMAYHHDLQLADVDKAAGGFVQVPRSMDAARQYREAESAYVFSGRDVRKVFKRWVPHRSPPELYNHGFENLESVGALYSRVSSHIFGDWNACGKVMGLGPWASKWSSKEQRGRKSFVLRGRVDGRLASPNPAPSNGGDAALSLDWDCLEALPHPNGLKALIREAGEEAFTHGSVRSGTLSAELAERRGMYASLAERVQADLEEVALDFVTRLRERTGETNLCLVGGVAQNSVLNGRIAREAGFDQVFISPYPGDEGIALGCAEYALHKLLPTVSDLPAPPLRSRPRAAYQGGVYSDNEVNDAIEEFLPWLEVVDVEAEAKGEGKATRGAAAAGKAAKQQQKKGRPSSVLRQEKIAAYVAGAIADGQIVGWVHGRAEVGARALGHRSILADPRQPSTHKRVNTIKRREQYRPLAPSVLTEEAESWFDGLPASSGGSPYMSLTCDVKPEVREKVPAITHVDGSARLQTVDAAEVPAYHALILAFFLLTGVPMVMNTSFNLAGMPIVESPVDALSCFLDADDDLSMLVLFGRVLRRKKFPEEGEAVRASTPVQQRAFTSRALSDASGDVLGVEVLVEGSWLELTDDLELELLERAASGGKLNGDEPSVADLCAALADETDGEVSEEDVVERLRHLYALRLISFEP